MYLSNSIGKVRDLPPPTDHKERKPPESSSQPQGLRRGNISGAGVNMSPPLGHMSAVTAKICLRSVERDVSSRLHLQKAHYVVDAPSSDIYPLLHVSSGQSAPLYITVTVNGCPLVMEIDTGASVSIACLETLKDIREGGALAEAGRAYHLAVDVHWGSH